MDASPSSARTELSIQRCPRCGKELVRRLDELECDACGYFVRQDFAGQASPRRTAPRWHAEAAAPLSTAAAGTERSFLRSRRLSSLKLAAMIGLGPLIYLAGALRYEAVQAGSSAGHNKLLLAAALVSLLLAGAFLYVDWQAMKRTGAVCAWLGAALSLGRAYFVFDNRYPLIIASPLLMFAVLVCIALLLGAEWNEESG